MGRENVMNTKREKKALTLVSAVAAAMGSVSVFGQAVNTSGPVQQGTSDGSSNYANNNPAVVISFSGQTALRSFDTSAGITELSPGTSIVLHDGTDGAPVEYVAPSDAGTYVQLANPNFTTPDVNPGTPTSPSTSDVQVASAIELQWHEQGSVDGFYDLINDEVGYNQTTGPISNEALRTPSSSNPTWINTNKFTAAGTANGFTLTNTAADDLANTYSTTVYNQATGQNLLGGQNRIQFSVGEYPTEAFSVAGTASPFASPGSAGYGQGNPALAQASTLTGLGVGGTRQTFQSSSIANESTSIEDPQTDADYASGPWNTAGANNISSTAIAATAVTYSANPGTGLERINESDAQWLQTTGRLQNGALFNVVARTVDTGQRIVFAANTGVDPSWAVGSNDDGNSTSTAAANAQHSIGPSLRFDGKTSGTEAEKTIAQSRMAVGALSVPEARAAASNAPIRALDVGFNYTSSNDPTLSSPGSDDNGSNAEFVRADFNTIVSSNSSTRYQAVLISHYNTVKSPNQTALNAELALEDINPATATQVQQQNAWSQVQSFDPTTAETDGTPSVPVSGIKGDTTGDVAAFISNIVNSNGTAAAGLTATTVNNPADNLFINGFLIPGLLDYTRVTDGGPITPVTLSSAALAEQSEVEANYGSLFTTDGSAASNNQTIGSSSTYADGNSSGPAVNGAIPITAKDVTVTNGVITSWSSATNNDLTAAGGNYLFGNFNQNGVRDYSDVQQAVNAALSLYSVDSFYGGTNSIYSGAPNGTVVASLIGDPGWQQTSTNTKGDLIVLGDYNGDGKFDGEDLYLLALGASLADSTSSNTLTATATTFADVVRNPNDVLRKNAALNYINNYLNTTTYTAGAAFLRQTARAVLTGSTVPFGATDLDTQDPITGLEQFSYDPTGANAFNPADVNRDGVVDLNDAFLVDEYNGQSYENQTQSLAATAQTPVTGAIEQISLVAVQQVDGESAIGSADVQVLNTALTGIGNTNWYGYNLDKTGPGTVTWARTGGAVTVYSGASVEISGGTLQIGGTEDPFTDNNAPGVGSTAGNHVAVTVNNGGKLQFIQNALTSTVASLTVDTASNSVVDIGNNALIIDYGATDPAATIRSYIVSGYAGGTWTGAGINSSVAAASSHYGVGYADGADGVVSGLSSGQIEVKYTLYGDANLDGVVNGTDFGILAASFGQQASAWDKGDFTYDGVVNGSDFGLLAANFGQQSNGAQVALPSSDWTALDTFAEEHGLLADVPEPGSAALLGLAGLGLLGRRRRKA
jgi:hypothetical protein